jgi:hypothetical protein
VVLSRWRFRGSFEELAVDWRAALRPPSMVCSYVYTMSWLKLQAFFPKKGKKSGRRREEGRSPSWWREDAEKKGPGRSASHVAEDDSPKLRSRVQSVWDPLKMKTTTSP